MATQKQLESLKKARAAKAKKSTAKKRKTTKKPTSKKVTNKRTTRKSTKSKMQLDVLSALVNGDMPKARKILTKLKKS